MLNFQFGGALEISFAFVLGDNVRLKWTIVLPMLGKAKWML